MKENTDGEKSVEEADKRLQRYQYIAYLVGFLDLFAVSLFTPLFPKFARSVNISTVNIGLCGSIYGFLQFFSSPVVGNWSDKAGKANVLCKCLFFCAIGYYISGLTVSIYIIFMTRVIVGCFKHTQSLTKAYLTDSTPHEKHRQVFGFHTSISNFGFIVGPTIGGIIAESEGGFHLATLIGATIFVIQSLLVFFMLPDIQSSKTSKDRLSRSPVGLLKNLKELFVSPRIRDILLIQLVLSGSSLLFRENSSLLLHVQHQTSSREIGFMISFANLVSSVSGFFVSRIAKFYGNDDCRLLSHCIVVHVVCVLCCTFTPYLLFYNTFLVPYKLSQAVCRVAVMNIMVEHSAGRRSGELMGTSQSVIAIARFMAPFVCGLLQEFTVLLPGCLAAILGLVALPFLLKKEPLQKLN